MADDIVPTADGAQDLGTDEKRWGAVKALSFVANGIPLAEAATLAVATTIGTPGVDTALATEKAVRDALAGAGGGTYTNAATTPTTVGGIAAGSSFDAATMTEMWDALLYPELFPTLTAPSNGFSLTESGLREIGEVVATLHFAATFSRGAISPAYTTSGYRSGLPNTYRYTGTGLPATAASTSLTDSQTVSSYTVLTGAQSWGGSVSYDAGEQPKSSAGNNYSTALSAGTTGSVAATITGVYPAYASTATIGTLTKQTLAAMNSAYLQTSMVAEAGADKQTADFPDGWSAITGIQFYNTVSSAWEWLGGGKVASLAMFTASGTTHTIQGNSINYDRYTHNGSQIGARLLRWHTT